MCAQLSNNKKISQQILSYPLAIRSEANRQLINTLQYTQKAAQEYLKKFYQEDVLDALAQSNNKSYKVLEPLTPKRWKSRIPSRVNRGILEVSGRILRTINARRSLFALLVQTFGPVPDKWSYQKLIAKYQIYIKSQYISNLSEQVANFFAVTGEYPKDFLALQKAPVLHQPMLSYAPDDGQAIKINKHENHLEISFKVLADGSKISNPNWQWIKIDVPLPSFIADCPSAAPDLRLVNIRGQLLPILDYKIQVDCPDRNKSPYFLTVDWGTRKLLTLCVFDRQGQQICPPVFLKFEPIQKKLLRIRAEIDHLKSQRDCLPKHSSLWKKYNQEIARRWRKFRAIQKELAHFASGVIVLVAQIYNCSEIYVEWLKSLKSKKFGRTLNWIINTTVREAIYEKVQYKANLAGIVPKRPVQPYGTSQYCPRCGQQGIHTKSPDHKENIKSGGWFCCTDCGFNADRDYVACCNLARKVLYGNLSGLDKGIAYKAIPISDQLFRQSKFPRERLLHHLSGWKDGLSLTPQKFFCGTLRS